LPVSTIAELSNFSKAFISQVRNGKRPPSKKLLDGLESYYLQTSKGKQNASIIGIIEQFLKSRRDGVSLGTIDFYRKYLTKSLPMLGLTPKPNSIQSYIVSLKCSVGGKHAYFRAISIFFNWLYSPKSGSDYSDKLNPITMVEAPKRPKLILPSLSKEQVQLLIEKAHSTRDKAIIALFTESGLRLSELLNIKLPDISWESRTIRVLGKGNKEGYAPFGLLAEQCLKCWLTEYNPQPNQHIWNIGFWGIKAMLAQLSTETGLTCNPHTFRRTFACLLRKAGVENLSLCTFWVFVSL
jgi:site-specific recombinase XerD